MPSKITQEVFDQRVAALNSIYDFSKAIYNGIDTKVTVICPHHGEFYMRPHDLYKGCGCSKCRSVKMHGVRVSSTPEFVIKANNIKNSFYSYPRTKYVNSWTKVIITCPIHGDFEQTPSNHLNGAGCPECGKSGFNQNKPATLYILNSGDTTKVGITNRDAQTRIREVRNTGAPDFEITSTFSLKYGKRIKEIETLVKRYLKSLYAQPTARYQGFSECFLNVDIPALLAFVTPLASPNLEIE